MNSVNNTVINCTANGNGLDGFFIGSNNTLTANTANGNGGSGIEVFADGNTLRANETDGNHFNGIFSTSAYRKSHSGEPGVQQRAIRSSGF